MSTDEPSDEELRELEKLEELEMRAALEAVEAERAAEQAPRDHGTVLILPPQTPPGILAFVGRDAVTMYRDDRLGFSLTIPTLARFAEPRTPWDASCELADAGYLMFQVRGLVPNADVSLPAAIRAVAADLTGATPTALQLTRPGVIAAVTAVQDSPIGRKVIDVLASEVAGKAAVVILSYDFGVDEIDPVTLATVRGTILGTAQFTAAPPDSVPAIFPLSFWLAPGLPLRLRADRPAVDGIAASVADELLQEVDLLAPAELTSPDVRHRAEKRLAAVLDPSAASKATATLVTVHDVRGLALAARGS